MRMVRPSPGIAVCRRLSIAAFVWLGCGIASGQAPFRAGIDGELYYCNRIDRIPVADGGPLAIELDGELDDAAWQRAEFHTYTEHWKGGTLPVDDADCKPEFAVVADDQFLYVAWRVSDANRNAGQSPGCSSFNDDDIEIHVDFNGEGVACGSCAYQADDAQLLIGADQIGKDDPALLDVGWVRSGGCVFAGPPIDGVTGESIISGFAKDLDSPEGLEGWQGEIAIALEANTYGEWHMNPIHGTVMGWDVHFDDDDDGDGQDADDSALIWSKRDGGSQAWQNPGVFGKLQFITPGKPLASITRDIADDLRNGTSGTVTFRVAPVFGEGVVVINEKLPAGFTASNPTGGGTIANDTVTWDLGKVTGDVLVSYTLVAGPDVPNIAMPGTATIDGEPLYIAGDTRYTGSPITELGFIKLWSHLGPLAYAFPAVVGDHGPAPVGACDGAGGPALIADWIQNEDESQTEVDTQPFPGLIVKPNYGGDGQPGGTGARAAGLTVAPGDDGLVVQDEYPYWKAVVSPDETVDHRNARINGFDADDQMTLSCVYVTNHTNAPIDTAIGLGSDDSIQVFLGDVDVTAGGIASCRGWGNPNEEQNILPVTLPTGESRVLVKVLDGGGASGFRLRFQDPVDPFGPGLQSPDLTVSVESTANPPPAKVVRDLSKQSVSLGETIDVSLAVATPAGAKDVFVQEFLPRSVNVSSISDGGTLKAGAIEWTLQATAGKTLTYKMAPGECRRNMTFGPSIWKAGGLEAFVQGESTLVGSLPVDQDLNAWESIDIGYTGGAAQALGDKDVLVSALGTGPVLAKDQIRFTYVPITGNFEFTTRIDCFEADQAKGAGGIMVRDTLDQSSANVYFFLSGKIPDAGGLGTLGATSRRETNLNRPSPTIPLTSADVLSSAIYLKMVRTETLIELFRSPDGVAYEKVGSKELGTGATQVTLPATVLVGLAAAGGNSTRTTITFRDVTGPPFTASSKPKFHRGDSDSNGKLELTDAIRILGYLFLGNTAPTCLESADTDNNGKLELTDAVRILGFLFSGSAPPATPGPPPNACGEDPEGTGDLGCVSYTSC